MVIPSLPFLVSASLPEVVWVLASALGMVVAYRAWRRHGAGAVRLKHFIRSVTSGVFLACGLISAFTPPSVNPSWLSVLTPMTLAFGAASMALLSVIDEQTV